MKKIIQILSISLVISTLATSSRAQMPLLQGDLVVTYRNGMNTTGNTSNVVSVLRAGNTFSAPMGSYVEWNTSTGKPAWVSKSNWTQNDLGNVFGITLDPDGNIYVSQSSIYGQVPTGKNGSIYKLHKTTGNPSLIISPSTFNQVVGEYGNLKFTIINGRRFLYISDWGNKKIHRFEEVGGVWMHRFSFDPTFGSNTDGQIPYGLAIRKTAGGILRLYYARMGKMDPNFCWDANGVRIITNDDGSVCSNSIIQTSVGPNDNELWSVDLSPVDGEFSSTSEQQEFLPGLAYQNPFADLAFTNDGKKMICGQQTLHNLTVLDAHRSNVLEFVEAGTGDTHNWQPSGALFPSGMSGHNAVGGVTYSNSILKTDNEIHCDTTVWFVSDIIRGGENVPKIYGLQGMKSSGGTYLTSIWIDEDDNTVDYDKLKLGDVEAFNKNCISCSCGQFSKPTLNGIPLAGGVIVDQGGGSGSTRKMAAIVNNAIAPSGYKLSFVKGNTNGEFHISYLCKGPCDATTEWSISKPGTRPQTINKDDGDIIINFGNFSNLDCGTYNLVITPKCGDLICDPFIMQIDIICEPPTCCDAKIEINKPEIIIRPSTKATSNSVLVGNISFTSDKPMSEVRLSIDEFRLSANAQSCLICKNSPNTWGNILNASLNGTPGQPCDPGPVEKPGIWMDCRESVFSSDQPMPLTPGILSFNLELPAITDLECCEVTVYICIKITFKDVNCRECVRMICDKYILKKNSKGTDVNTSRNPVIFTPIN